MKYNSNTGTQEQILIKKKLNSIESGLLDNADATQWLIENAVTRDEDGQIELGEHWFTTEDFEALWQLIHPDAE